MVLLLVPLVVFGVVFLLSGLFSYYRIVSQSPCKIVKTTKIEKKEIKVTSSVPNIKLYKFQSTSTTGTKHKGKAKILNPFPVLFVPGHNGK